MALLTDEQIVQILEERASARGARLDKMRKIAEAYDNELVLPLPEVDKAERPAVANLLNQGVDAMAQRVASTSPMVVFPVLGDGKAARKMARTRRDRVYSWWNADRMRLGLGQRARWFVAYASTVVHIVPHRDSYHGDRPQYRLRDPLTAFPSATDITDLCPVDCVFTYKRNLALLERRFGPIRGRLGLDPQERRPASQINVDVVEYVSAEETVLLAKSNDTGSGKVQTARLSWVPQRIGMCPIVVVGRPGLRGPVGQFDGMIGTYWQQAMLQALEIIAVKRGVFPDTWLVGSGGANPQVLEQADGIRGIIGRVLDGELKVINEQPGYQTNQTIDRLERNARVDARIPSEFGGESGSNIRTGRRGDSVMAAVVDFPVQETQQVFAASLEEENRRAIAIEREYFPGVKKVWVTGYGGGDREITFDTSKLWDEDACRHSVSYAHPGSDANGLAIAFGQRVGMRTMSLQTAMTLDPMVDDAEVEHDRIIGEALEQALLGAIAQQAQSGQIPAVDVARIIELVRGEDVDLVDAIKTAQLEAQQRQAAQPPPSAPEAQPGLAMPGQGVEPSIPQAPEGQRNLSGLLSSLRLPQMQIPAETGAA